MEKKNSSKMPVYGLTYEQYTGIRNLYGTLGVADSAINRLQNRIRSVPNGWRDARMLLSVQEKLLSRIVQTCPADRRLALSKELEHVHMDVKVTKPKKHESMSGQVTYVNEGPLERIVERVLQIECWGCEKKGRDVCDCQLRKDLQEIYHYEFPNDWRNGCPFKDELQDIDAADRD